MSITSASPQNIVATLKTMLPGSPENALSRRDLFSSLSETERQNFASHVCNLAADNQVDLALKRVAVLHETIRAFALRVLPLRLFSSVFSNVPLQGTDTVVIPYYPLQTVASSNRTPSSIPTYVFGQASATSQKTITLNKLKYQPLDYSSYEFRRQPFFDAVRLGNMNAEKLAVDVINDVLSVVTEANFGAAAKTTLASAITSDDVIDIRGACNDAMWPDTGRSLIVDSSVDTALQKDTSYKLALNIGTTDPIREGRFPRLSGFDYFHIPSLPANGESLIGFAAFASAILCAFAPVTPAPGVMSQLVAYEIVTDPATGISFTYRHWGIAENDRDYQVIECAYGYAAGVAAAIKRIVSA